MRFSLSDQYTRVVKENLRIFVNDSYRGFMYREQRAYLNELDPSLVSPREEAAAIGKNGKYYRGNVYLFKVMNRDNVNVAKPVDTEYRATISVDAAGRSAFADGEKVPLRTGFPSLSKEAVAVGETWQAEGVEHRLDEEGTFLEVPFRCNYTYKGRDEYQDRPVVVIGTSYTYRDLDSESNSNKTGLKLRGKIEGGIYLFTDSKGGYFIRERVERYLLGGAEGQRRESGFRLVWSEGFSREHIDAMEERIAEANNGAAGDGVAEEGGRGTEKEDEIEVSRSDEGVVLNLPNIHFEPDQAVILPEERSRLDKLAKLLRKVPEASFLVKGHTADVGSAESQIELSRERAKTIIDELAERGFAPTRFIYKGLGGSEPVASNESEEGRAKNRRVEIVVFSR
ncbi:MAG: OmpA family protein [Spirochaetia bacterium]